MKSHKQIFNETEVSQEHEMLKAINHIKKIQQNYENQIAILKTALEQIDLDLKRLENEMPKLP